MIRPRPTVRLLMATVLALAVALGLGLPAFEVWRENDFHVHTSVVINGPNAAGLRVEGAVSPPFWPRYWRRVLGRPWKHAAVCRPRPGHLEDLCVRAHPQILKPISPGRAAINWSRAQLDLAALLSGQGR